MLAATRLRLPHARRVVASHLPLCPLAFRAPASLRTRVSPGGTTPGTRCYASTLKRRGDESDEAAKRPEEEDGDAIPAEELTTVGSHEHEHEHAVISTFDLFSIGGA